MQHWLMKTEPSTFGVEHLAAAPRRTTAWDGVRNFQARNMLRDKMRRGDEAFLYHSSTEVPGVVAIMRMCSLVISIRVYILGPRTNPLIGEPTWRRQRRRPRRKLPRRNRP